MQTTKKRCAHFPARRLVRDGVLAAQPRHTNLVVLLLVVVLVGCTPPGPRALLDGKQYLDRGEYGQAIEELRTATRLMPTNALAFNYLGLALHQAGQSAEAERAYLRALSLDHDLSEIHYDLGCLWLSESNRLDQAKYELTAYTLRRPNMPEGWVKLGQAQLRSRELTAAEHSLDEAVRLAPHNPEALTELGVVLYQRRRPHEAAPLFAKALQERADYAPALLNSAILAQEQNDPRLALERYREYAALKPAPENLPQVVAVMQQLQQQLSPPPREPATNHPVSSVATITNPPKASVPEPAHPVTVAKPPPTNATHASAPVRSEPATNVTKNTAASAPPHMVATNPPPEPEMPVVHLPADPTIKPAQDTISPSVPARPAESPPRAQTASGSPPLEARPPKRGFFQRINPINLFAHEEKSSTGSVPPASTSLVPSPESSVSNGDAGGAEARSFPRYAYLSPAKPVGGNRSAAEQAFAQGVKLQEARRYGEAVQAYRRAVELDPAFYDAQYNLGLAAAENRSLPLALAAYETALAIEPESLDARYNFGLVLKQAGYIPDAVAQFEKILAQYPNDARTHLALGNLYAQQLHDNAKARQHYQAVLAVAPQSPQAGAILYWLTDHPR